MGNPNPSPATRFGGSRGNQPGKTAEQKRLEMANAEMATRIRFHLLERRVQAIEEPLDTAQTEKLQAALKDVLTPEQLLIVYSALSIELTPELLKLIKDSEDRGLGAPTQTLQVEHLAGLNDEELEHRRRELEAQLREH